MNFAQRTPTAIGPIRSSYCSAWFWSRNNATEMFDGSQFIIPHDGHSTWWCPTFYHEWKSKSDVRVSSFSPVFSFVHKYTAQIFTPNWTKIDFNFTTTVVITADISVSKSSVDVESHSGIFIQIDYFCNLTPIVEQWTCNSTL